MSDIIDVEILKDGTLKISTNKIGIANHGNAEALIKEITTGAGGEVTRIKKGMVNHTHNQGQQHEH